MTITLTAAAAEYVKKKLAERGTPDSALRIGIRGSGCNGYRYHLEYSDYPPTERDKVFEMHGVKVFVDPKSLLFLKGATLDYEKTMMNQGLKFINPNEASTCGCGESFTVK